ncbi:FMRFamide receptor [Aplysia californica]|uniref:FMRFamide receptor n=1 Tax=Aplysia californica TaxID=6500 RepID=A0ABM0K9U7_APLCA|nr:FMRFamide receptor [Aplysia californica]
MNVFMESLAPGPGQYDVNDSLRGEAEAYLGGEDNMTSGILAGTATVGTDGVAVTTAAQQDIDRARANFLKFIVWGIMGSILAALGFLGNTLSMVVLQQRQMRSSTSYYLLSLAIYDNCVLLGMTLYFILPALAPYRPELTDYHSTFALTIPVGYPLSLSAQMGSIYTCVGFTVERFIAVCRPLHVANTCTKSRTLRAILLVFIWAILYNIPRFFHYELEYVTVPEASGAGSVVNATVETLTENTLDIGLQHTGCNTTAIFGGSGWSYNGTGYGPCPPGTEWGAGLEVNSSHDIGSPTAALFTRDLIQDAASDMSRGATLVESAAEAASPSSATPITITTTTSSSSSSSSSTVPPAPKSVIRYSETEFGLDPTFQHIYLIYSHLFFMFLLPFLIILVMNVGLIRAVKRSKSMRQSMSASASKEHNLTVMLIAVIVVFLVCQFPTIVDNILVAMVGEKQLKQHYTYMCFYIICTFMVEINAASNFLLYCFFGKKFRMTFLSILGLKRKQHHVAYRSTVCRSKTNGTRVYDMEVSVM